MMNKYFLKYKQQRGFTLVEALVAIFILTMGLIPSLSIILLANSFNFSIRNNLIAANLAQEGVEVVRAIRDTNWFNNRAFDAGLAPGIYRVQYNSEADGLNTFLLPEDGNPPLLIENGMYNYTSGKDTTFKRRILIDKDTSLAGCNCELRVIVEVEWPERKRTKTAIIESHLFDWQ